VALERDPQVLGGDVLAAAPLLLEALALGRETLREPLHDLGDELVGLLDGLPRLVDESGLDRLPAALELRVLPVREPGRSVGAKVAGGSGALRLGALRRRRVGLTLGLGLCDRLFALGVAGDLSRAETLSGLHHLTSSTRSSDRVVVCSSPSSSVKSA